MSDFFSEEAPMPAQVGSHDVFGPHPETLMKMAEKLKADVGENSLDYASIMVKVGDAHMMQGKLSNPRAQECYEKALHIVQSKAENSAAVAYVLDKLANVKQSSGDTAGAATDLKKAIEIWKPLDAKARHVSDEHVVRRMEDLQRMQKLIDFSNRRPPGM